MSINNDKHVDMNVDNYSPSELFLILDIQDPTKENIQEATNKMIQQFTEEGNMAMVEFFKNAETRMLNDLPEPNDKNLVNFDNKFNSQNTDDNQLGQWWSQQKLTQSDSIQADKTTERKQRVGLYDNNHNIMKRERLGVANNFSVPVAQGQMNPNLKNTCTRLVNIDSQFRQNSFPAKNGLPYDQIANPHTSTYSSTDFTVDLTDTLNNVISLKLYSVTIPYSWYTIDVAYGTNCFLLKIDDTWYNITIDNGNYTVDEGDTDIIAALNAEIWSVTTYDLTTWSEPFKYIKTSGKVVFTPPDNTSGTIIWYLSKGEINNTDIFGDNPPTMCDTNCGIGKKANSNLGYLLGFRNTQYEWNNNLFSTFENTTNYNDSGENVRNGQSFTVPGSTGTSNITRITTTAIGGSLSEITNGIQTANIRIREWVNNNETDNDNNAFSGTILATSNDGTIINSTNPYGGSRPDLHPVAEFIFSPPLKLTNGIKYVAEIIKPNTGTDVYVRIPGPYSEGQAYAIGGPNPDEQRDIPMQVWTATSIISEAIINLYGPRYLMLILDDYNQNHLNKGLVSIQDVPKKADLPSYYDPNLPCINTKIDPTQGVLQPYPYTLPGGPRKLTKAKQDTINSIMKDRSQTTSNKVRSVTDSDMFALIPIKKSINTQIGEGLTEFSGPIQVNERIYFGPVDIDRMRIRLVTDKGDTLNLNGNDWSFCMIAEVLYQY